MKYPRNIGEIEPITWDVPNINPSEIPVLFIPLSSDVQTKVTGKVKKILNPISGKKNNLNIPVENRNPIREIVNNSDASRKTFFLPILSEILPPKG